MKIKEYIQELLFTNQGVIIPGLGGFVSKYEPAEFDVNENKFLPPSKKITFKPEYSYQDHLLIDFISEKENIDKEKSTALLNDFVDTIKNKLQEGEKINFPKIGTLTKNVKGEIRFEQDTDSNFLTDSFGLKQVKTSPINQPENRELINDYAVPKRNFKKTIVLSIIGIAFLSIIGFSWVFTDGFSDFSILSEGENTAADKNIGLLHAEKNLESIANADSVMALINMSIDENTDIKDALFYEEPQKQTGAESALSYSKFQIVAGSFRNIENAQKFSSILRNKGFNPEIIQSGENLFRIVIYTYTDEISALKELYRLRQNSNIHSVWILKSM